MRWDEKYTPAFSARVVANAFARLTINRTILESGMEPSATASMRAWKLDPLPEAMTRMRQGSWAAIFAVFAGFFGLGGGVGRVRWEVAKFNYLIGVRSRSCDAARAGGFVKLN